MPKLKIRLKRTAAQDQKEKKVKDEKAVKQLIFLNLYAARYWSCSQARLEANI